MAYGYPQLCRGQRQEYPAESPLRGLLAVFVQPLRNRSLQRPRILHKDEYKTSMWSISNSRQSTVSTPSLTSVTEPLAASGSLPSSVVSLNGDRALAPTTPLSRLHLASFFLNSFAAPTISAFTLSNPSRNCCGPPSSSDRRRSAVAEGDVI